MGRNPATYTPSLSDWGRAIQRIFKKKDSFTINPPQQTKTVNGVEYKYPSTAQIRMVNRILSEPVFDNGYHTPATEVRITFDADDYSKKLDLELLRRISDGHTYDIVDAGRLNSYREAFKRILNKEPFTVTY